MAVQTQPIIESRTLIGMAQSNYGIIQSQVKDLTPEDSLLQLPFRGNCLNWVLGHITQSRNKMLRLVNEEPVWTDEQIARYDTDSQPVTCADDAMPFEQILADLTTTHQRLTDRLKQISLDDLAAPARSVIPNLSPRSTAMLLHSLLWHETYHVGQTELLRQLAGKNDKVI